jgi:hypothetical protein
MFAATARIDENNAAKVTKNYKFPKFEQLRGFLGLDEDLLKNLRIILQTTFLFSNGEVFPWEKLTPKGEVVP